MPPHDIPQTPERRPSEAESAMSANARSRDQQGKAQDRARHENCDSMTGEGAPENPGQPGNPTTETH